MAGSEELLMGLDGPVAWLTLNRPARHNALSSTLLVALAEAVRELSSGGKARCIILRGAGNRAFSAGIDLAAIPSGDPADVGTQIQAGSPLALALDAIEETPLPVIAMIRGWCLGAGCETSMACDLRIGSEDCRMGMPTARMGILYPPGGVQRIMRAVGPAAARKIFLTARYFGAEEALLTGLLNYVVPGEELEAFTMQLAADIVRNAPLSVSGHKRTLYHLTRPTPLAGEAEAEIYELAARALSSEDAREALKAFAEKRDPLFKGE